jgi:hypothetical protein
MTEREPDPATCPSCGSEVPSRRRVVHACDWWSWLDHQVELRREELDRFERELGSYLRTPSGHFELWYAERERRGRTPGGC